MVFFILLLALDINSGIIEALLVILPNNDKILLRQGNNLNINILLALKKNGENCIRLPLFLPSKLCSYSPKDDLGFKQFFLIFIVYISKIWVHLMY